MMRTPFLNYHFLIRKFDLIVNDIRNFVYHILSFIWRRFL